jgi:hypothetical protein
LDARPSHQYLLVKVCEKIAEIFKEEARGIRLEVEKGISDIRKCPDCEYHRATEYQTLWVYVQVATDVDTVIKLEDEYTDWHIDHISDCDLSIHVEFTGEPLQK